MAVHTIFDAGGNVARQWWYDDADGRFGWKANQDASDVLERVQQKREAYRHADPKRFQMEVCEIPLDMVEVWLAQRGLTWHQYSTDPGVKAKLIAHCQSEWPHLMISSPRRVIR